MISNPSILYFGSPEIKEKIEKALQEGNIEVVENKKTGLGSFQMNGSVFGTVVMVESDEVFMIIHEEDNVLTPAFPWTKRKNEFVFHLPFKETNSISVYEKFVAVVRQFESYLREYLKDKTDQFSEHTDILPQGFYGILQYEFFKEIIEHTTSIEISFAEPETIKGKKALIAMVKVFGTDPESPVDCLEISDIIVF